MHCVIISLVNFLFHKLFACVMSYANSSRGISYKTVNRQRMLYQQFPSWDGLRYIAYITSFLFYPIFADHNHARHLLVLQNSLTHSHKHTHSLSHKTLGFCITYTDSSSVYSKNENTHYSSNHRDVSFHKLTLSLL